MEVGAHLIGNDQIRETGSFPNCDTSEKNIRHFFPVYVFVISVTLSCL